MQRCCWFVFLLGLSFGPLPVLLAQPATIVRSTSGLDDVGLSDEQWAVLDPVVERALSYLAQTQARDGSFVGPAIGQPGITSLSCLALLSGGAVPGEGKYGDSLTRAIDYVLETQQDDGLFSFRPPERSYVTNNAAHAALYNHALGGLLLTEVYGMTSSQQRERISAAIPKAIALTRKMQINGKRRQADRGGWKYFRPSPHTPADSDLSVTAWQIMFLRSAKNAEFDVPDRYVSEAIEYVNRCFIDSRKEFLYGIQEPVPYTSRGVIGAGIFALALGGDHDNVRARLAADQLLVQAFDYNVTLTPYEQYHYTIYHCSQAMFQLGGKYWSNFFPPLLKTLAENQLPDGSWVPSRGWAKYGASYTVSLTVLALTPPYQILPIFQR